MRIKTTTGPLVALILSSLWFCPNGYTALQGERDAESSTAVTTISLNIAPSIQISNVSDITLNVSNRNEDARFEEQVCIRGNLGSRYSVTAASQDGSQNPFELQTTTGDSIGYQVYFRGDLGQVNTDQLFPGQASPYYSMQTQVQDCSGEDTAAFYRVYQKDGVNQTALVLLNKGDVAADMTVSTWLSHGNWRDAASGEQIEVDAGAAAVNVNVAAHGVRVLLFDQAVNDVALATELARLQRHKSRE